MGNSCGEKPVLQRGIPRGGSLVFLCSLTSCASPAVLCCALRAKGEKEKYISCFAGTFYGGSVTALACGYTSHLVSGETVRFS